MSKYYWSGISRDERIKAISDIQAIVDKYATIINFQRFSDISLGLILELEEKDLLYLRKELVKILLIDENRVEKSGTENNCMIFLNITFALGTGNMIIEVPEIPG
ncbi:MAG: hypothetical protein IPH45_13355 [Bacteroidales bacterium]|nr:hypothetical protein [Bacteroidales bacterium]MBK7173731.1 hypothetical protein [Bacteroidales bacterium]